MNKTGNKGEERWYPTYAPHIILGTNKSIIDCVGKYGGLGKYGGYGLLNNNSQGIQPMFGEMYKRIINNDDK